MLRTELVRQQRSENSGRGMTPIRLHQTQGPPQPAQYPGRFTAPPVTATAPLWAS